MKYDFDKLTDRRDADSYKWDVKENELPMWVADMDFETAPCVREALRRRVEHGIFGYMTLPNKWYEAYQYWWKTYHGCEIEREWLIFTTGVIPAISTAVRKFTTPAEKIIVQTPVYNMFFNSIKNNGRVVLENPLLRTENGYEMDFGDLEKKLSDPLATMLILCNPHNPVGKIWDKNTLRRVGELCKKYGVLVLSDEIHCDLLAPDKEYVPFAVASETCREISITAIAPTKTFNIAGLQTAAVAVPDRSIRNRMWRALNTDEVAEPSAFAVDAAVAAFSEEGREWLMELRQYIQENKDFVEGYLKENLPSIQLVSKDATYLLWLDISHYSKDSKAFADFLRKETGLFVSTGAIYRGDGDHFLRLNVATQRSRVEDGMRRLSEGIRKWEMN